MCASGGLARRWHIHLGSLGQAGEHNPKQQLSQSVEVSTSQYSTKHAHRCCGRPRGEPASPRARQVSPRPESGLK